MDKKVQLYKKLMESFEKSLVEGDELQQNNIQYKYIVVVAARNHERLSNKIVRSAMDAEQICSAKVVPGYADMKIHCTSYKDILEVLKCMAEKDVFAMDSTLQISITAKAKSGINDSVNENSENVISGDFVTDFTYSTVMTDDTEVKVSPAEAAEWHVKYLVNHGLQVDIQEKRYSFVYYIHYEGIEQYELLVKWVAWHMGLIETMGNHLGRADKAIAVRAIEDGKDLKWDIKK